VHRSIVASGLAFVRVAANVPTFIESGLPEYVISRGFSLFGPAGLARPIVDRVNSTPRTALGNADVRNQLAGQGADPVGSSPEEDDAFNLETAVGRGEACGHGGAGKRAPRSNGHSIQRGANEPCAARTVQSAR